MGDVIDFKPKKTNIEVQLEEDDSQRMLELAILVLFEEVGGHELYGKITADEYNLVFIQFTDVCYSAMEDEAIIVDEDNNVSIVVELRRDLKEAMDDFKKELESADTSIH